MAGVEFTTDVEFDPNLLALFTPNALQGAIVAGLEAVGVHIQSAAMRNSPVVTGFFRDHWETPEVNATALEVTVRNTVEYASFVEEDTRPHEIRPVNAKALSWLGSAASSVQGTKMRQARGARMRRAGQTPGTFRGIANVEASDLHFAQVVHHPGTTGQHVAQRTINEELQPSVEMMNAALSRLLDAG